jgi:ankyrin repeat protein
MLLDHGAAVDLERADGRTAYALALRAGNTAAAALLRERGADPTRVRPADELLGAAMAGDATGARAVLVRHPEVRASLALETGEAMVLAAEEGRTEVVGLLHELGFDVVAEGADGGTPLHHAAWHARSETVRALLALGAPVNARDRTFGSSPLGWAAHGSGHGRRGAEADYAAVVELLAGAGATREAAFNRWGEPPERLATRQIAALLRRRDLA